MADKLAEIAARADRKVSAKSVADLDTIEWEFFRQKEKTKIAKEKALDEFWANFDKIFQPGDRIQWYNGWDLEVSTFKYHDKWHVNLRTDDGVDLGIPIIVDTDFEKIV